MEDEVVTFQLFAFGLTQSAKVQKLVQKWWQLTLDLCRVESNFEILTVAREIHFASSLSTLSSPPHTVLQHS